MKNRPVTVAPSDAEQRKSVEPVICYPIDTLPKFDPALFSSARESLTLTQEVTIQPRDARCVKIPAGHFFRIVCPDRPQVGDLNLWNANDLNECFYSGKTRALHGTHVSSGDRLWSKHPYFRPMATITHDTLDWYGWDEFGGSVHDVIGTRCDPYTNKLLSGNDYHYCCHSNLIRALSTYTGMTLEDTEPYIHDVLNVFMCTGFTKDTKQYFMKASPVRQGDYLEMFAEIGLLVGLSTCPGGDCSSQHSSDTAICSPLKIEVYKPALNTLIGWRSPKPSEYSGSHGM